MEEIPGEDEHAAYAARLAEALPHRARAVRRRAGARCSPARRSSRPTRSPRASLDRRSVALIFEKPSTRTRISFEAGIVELGGHPMVLRTDEMQVSRGESICDVALVLSRHVAAIGLRTGSEAQLAELAEHADGAGRQHALAAPPPVPGARRPAHAARGATATCAAAGSPTSATATTSPARWRSSADRRARGGDRRARRLPARGRPRRACCTDDPAEAVDGACAVYTDVWVSHERRRGRGRRAPPRARALPARRRAARPRRARAPSPCTACPPTRARRSRATVLYGDRQRIWDQAENRRHAQKALLELLLGRRVTALQRG